MKDFRLYDIHDFLLDEDFIRWARLRNHEDCEFWDKWLNKNPDKHFIIAEAKGILENLGNGEDLISDRERERNIRELLVIIGKTSMPAPDGFLLGKLTKRAKGIMLAAAVLLSLAIGSWFFFQPGKPESYAFEFAETLPSSKWVESVNSTNEPVTLRLPDKSTVKLSPNSRIAYAQDFDTSGSRDVYLIGEAMFSVQKNPLRPFRVFANDIMTKVLGTSFSVRSYSKDSAVHVAVNTGKVGVYLNKGGKEFGKIMELDGIILTPNQELIYQKDKRKFRKTLRENPKMVVPEVEDNYLAYDDYPLEKVLRQLTENFGVSILFDSELLGPCTITADLRTVPFYEKLDLICKAIGGKYEIIDGQVIIEAKGCY